MNTLDLVQHGPVIPVIVIDRLEDAVPLAQALVAGGVRVLEAVRIVRCRGVEIGHRAQASGVAPQG